MFWVIKISQNDSLMFLHCSRPLTFQLSPKIVANFASITNNSNSFIRSPKIKLWVALLSNKTKISFSLIFLFKFHGPQQV